MSFNEIRDESQPGCCFRRCIQASCQFLIFLARGRVLNLVSSIPAKWNLDDPNWIVASQKLRDLLRVPYSGRQTYPLKTPGTNLFQPFQAYSELNASSIACQFMDLINHD